MTLEEEAEDAASRVWPPNHLFVGRKAALRDFARGYIAGATRPVTDAEVEAAARSIEADEGECGVAFTPNDLGEVCYKHREQYLEVARNALEAARKARMQ